MKDKQIIQISMLARAIKEWAQEKKAFISLHTYIREIEEWRRLTGVYRFKRMLEIGSGSGWFLITAVAIGFAEEGVGVDPARRADGTDIQEIKRAKSTVKELGLNERVRFHICSFEDFLVRKDLYVLKNEKFDLLVFRNTLHHIYPRLEGTNYDEFANKCIKDLHIAHHLLNEHGYLYVMEATRPSKFYSAMYNFYRTLRGAPIMNWTAKRTPFEWTQIFEKAGFTGIGIKWLHPHHPLLLRIPVSNVVSRFLSHQFLIAARALRT